MGGIVYFSRNNRKRLFAKMCLALAPFSGLGGENPPAPNVQIMNLEEINFGGARRFGEGHAKLRMQCRCVAGADHPPRRFIGAGFSPFPIPPPQCGEAEILLPPGKLHRIGIRTDSLRAKNGNTTAARLQIYGGDNCALLADSQNLNGGVFYAPQTGAADLPARMRVEIGGEIELGQHSEGHYGGNYQIIVEAH